MMAKGVGLLFVLLVTELSSALQLPSVDASAPLTSTILFVPLAKCSQDLSFIQRSTNSRIDGLSEIQDACKRLEGDFQSEMGVEAGIERVSTISSTLVRLNWNVTWVPPTSLWLEGLAKAWPGVEPVYTPYNHLSSEIVTFSWKAVGKLFADAFAEQELRVPLACIEGISDLTFDDDDTLRHIEENLVYAVDLNRGSLRNRKCADDLRVFLETGRRIQNGNDNWCDVVIKALPWSSVPGSNPLDVDPLNEDEASSAPVIFLGVVVLFLLLSMQLLAPELAGQSLFGPPNYIVQPEDLHSIF